MGYNLWRKPNEAKTFYCFALYFLDSWLKATTIEAMAEFSRFKRFGKEVFLGDFAGFLFHNPLGQVRDCEIRLIFYRIVERDESRKSVKKTIALKQPH